MNKQPDIDVERFWRDGYLLMKNVFSVEEANTIRERAYEVLRQEEQAHRVNRSGGITYILGDLLSKNYLRDLVFDPRILDRARQILGGPPVYFGFSSFQMGSMPDYQMKSLGWHKDNRIKDRNNSAGLDWQGERYGLIRFGLYLQDHARHGGGLAVRVGSHNLPTYRDGKPVLIPSEVGDLLVWNKRITHSGHGVRLKFMPSIAVDRGLRLAPSWMRIKPERERVAIFITYGLEGEHLDRYMEYLRTERPDEIVYWKNSHFGEEVWQTAREKNLTIVRLIPEYGTASEKKDHNAEGQ